MCRLPAVLLMLLLAVVYADPLPVPEVYGETEEMPAPERYSWEAGLFGNLVPGLGYFLIEEPIWGVVEIGLVGGGVALMIIGANQTGSLAGFDEILFGACIMNTAYLGGLIHAPLLALEKNERLEYALYLSPGLGVSGDGEFYPTLSLALRF